MRVLVTGAGGQLGSDVLATWRDDDVVAATHAELDVSDEAAVRGAVLDLQPEVVVNTAAWTDVDACEADEDRAHAVNALGPWWLARACADAGAVLVQLSTDYVFGGPAPRDVAGQPRPWTEFDPVAPVNVYGRSKVAGEQLVRATLPHHLVVRTAWLAGARGGNFVRSVLDAGRRDGRLEVAADQVGCPTFTGDLAPALRQLVVAGRPGTFHRTNAGRCSRVELARAIIELAGLEVEVVPVAEPPPRPAPRPAWSVLDERHARLSGLPPLRPWRAALADLLVALGERRPAAGR